MENAGLLGSTRIRFMSTNSAPILQVCLSKAWGGLEMAAFELARDYSKRGISITTICPTGSMLAGTLRDGSLPVIEVKSRKYFAPRATLAIRAAVKKLQPSTV